MIWNTIQGARVKKKAMRVAWLDLANAYDWLHHNALDFFFVPKSYHDAFQVRFSPCEYTARWQLLETIILMGIHFPHFCLF